MYLPPPSLLPFLSTLATVCPPLLLLLQDAVKVMAKSLIRNRHAVTKLHGLKSQLQAVSLRIQVGEHRPCGRLFA